MPDSSPPVQPVGPEPLNENSGAHVNPQVAHLNAVTQLAGKNPTMALLVLVLGAGGGAGTVGSLFVAPAINDRMSEHEKDPRAHATEFERLANIERRMDKMENKIDSQGNSLSSIKAGIESLKSRSAPRSNTP